MKKYIWPLIHITIAGVFTYATTKSCHLEWYKVIAVAIIFLLVLKPFKQ